MKQCAYTGCPKTSTVIHNFSFTKEELIRPKKNTSQWVEVRLKNTDDENTNVENVST